MIHFPISLAAQALEPRGPCRGQATPGLLSGLLLGFAHLDTEAQPTHPQ